jgi:Na+/proline symporter
VVNFVQLGLFLLLGVMLFVFALHAPLPILGGDTDRIFPEFVVRYMPAGLAGLVLASMFAVAMSNASGALNSLAASSVIDLGMGKRIGGVKVIELGMDMGAGGGRIGRNLGTGIGTGVDADRSARLGRSRRVTLIWGVVLGLLGMVRWGPVLEAGLTIASITYGGLLGVFLLGTWNRRANETGALVGFAVGIATMIVVRFETPLAFTWYAFVGTLVTFAVGSLASLVWRGAARQTAVH